MKKIDFPVGISDFSKIRENEYYYIDKTGLICEVLKNPGTEVTLITRPRRFGYRKRQQKNISRVGNFQS